jgi:hypothetical protein
VSEKDGNGAGDSAESPGQDGPFPAMVGYNWTLQREQTWHRAAAFMAANGASAAKIGKAFGKTAQCISNLQRNAFFQQMMREEMEAAQRDIRSLFRDELINNLEVLKAIRDDPDELAAPRIMSVKEINDRALGRPTQPIVETSEVVCANPVEQAARLEDECRRLLKDLNFTLDD